MSYTGADHEGKPDELRWRTGVVPENPLLESTAVVRADNKTRRIHIKVSGKERKVFLALPACKKRSQPLDWRKGESIARTIEELPG